MFIRHLQCGALVLLIAVTTLLQGCSSEDSDNNIQGPTYSATDFFVSTADGDDANSGIPGAPFATIQRAMDTAAVTGGCIFVAEGDYNENVVLAKGVSIFGGYKVGTFVRDAAAVTTINGSDISIRVANADTVTIDGFTINCADATTVGGSSVAISLSNAREITIANNVIHAGKGAAGSALSKPVTPDKSPNGLPGIPANDDGCSLISCENSDGGAGGELIGMSGGDGGDACNTAGCSDGEDGVGPDGGAGGDTKSTLGGRGDDGGNGGAGTSAGAHGLGGTAFGSILSGAYVSAAGSNGGEGDHGSGGGGGGGGGTLLAKGGSGGGGGAGAQGGLPGPGGGGGGASIAILLTGNSQASIQSNSITTGSGGAGGAGAPGGDSGILGVGAAGGGGNLWGAAGGNGGNGGAGKMGGSGGGGGGGPSIGIVEAASSTTTRSGNTYTLGAGGLGGSSSENIGANGQVADHLKL